jgi:hypothetical protein
MKPERRPFMPLSIAVDDEKLEQLAREKGVGKFEQPPAVDSRAGEGAQPAEVMEPPDVSKINFEAPHYLATALKIHAARERTSVRHVILKALRAGGFAINDADMIEDGRRLRGSNRPH